ncbi:glycosyltransferase family 4 protein [Erythrobacter sp.]|jgi:glycosyltransferase involved in cell wall biosynthesis|uniref:glycosyltransferase family 4 protein n=1 Tax=Erythrobacter sp. TaxID=1042 RepID=UPI002EBF3418|nr:glycosyltransferase family 4 protein [Erythrobacter sp.]
MRPLASTVIQKRNVDPSDCLVPMTSDHPDASSGHPRILFVLPSLGAGGSERVVTTLTNHWAGEGRDVGIATFDARDFSPFYPLARQVRFFPLNLPAPKNGLPAQISQTVRRIRAIEGAYRAYGPDAVISFLTKTNIMAILAARRSRLPVIVSERNNPTLQRFNAMWRAARAYTYPKAFAFVTMTDGAASYYPANQRPRTTIIPNPVQLPKGWSNRREGNTITAVGRLTGQKQFHLLIEAFASIAAQFPKWNLTIWGEGEARAELEALRASHGLDDRVSLPGLTTTPGQWVETADILVLSSAYEGWPNVIVEAMAAELPVVAFDCEHGVSDMIDSGVSGQLVSQGDVAGLAGAMASLMANPALRRSLAANALAASARYNTASIADEWMRLVQRALGSKST